jgi:hypothetical protein
MPTIHLSAHHKSGKRFLAVGQDDTQAKQALYASVARADVDRSFIVANEYYHLMKHLREFEETVKEKCVLLTQDSEEWSLRRVRFENQTIYELDDLPGVKTFQL